MSKKWIVVDEVIELLSGILKEEFSTQDVLYYAVEERFKVYWHLKEVYAREVALQSRTICESISGMIGDAREYPVLPRETGFVWRTLISTVNHDSPCSSRPDVKLNGIFELNLNLAPGRLNHLLDFYPNQDIEEGNCIPFIGTIVVDSNEVWYELMEDLEKSEARKSSSRKEKLNMLAAIENDEERRVEAESIKKFYCNDIAVKNFPKSIKKKYIEEFFQRVDAIGFGDFAEHYSADFETDYEKKPELSELVFDREEIANFAKSLMGSEDGSANIDVAPKSKNAMLRTIEALTEALIGGLTHEPHTNAEACLSALNSKGVTAPIKKDALAKYLSEARKLNKN